MKKYLALALAVAVLGAHRLRFRSGALPALSAAERSALRDAPADERLESMWSSLKEKVGLDPSGASVSVETPQAAAVGEAPSVSPAVQPVEPDFLVTRGHSHNDYKQHRPLFEAMELGFCSVEADVNLVDGALLVAHKPREVDPRKTLESLYLDPLLAQVRANGGKVYRQGPSVQLLVEFKSDAEQTYAALKPVLERYSSMLTSFDKDGAHPGAVTVVITGHVPWDSLRRESLRYAAGDTDQPSSDDPETIAPLLSLKWGDFFSWSGHPWDGRQPPPEQLAKLQSLVKEAHQRHRRLRLWDAPDNERTWSVLYDAGVDLINTNDLAGLHRFLQGRAEASAAK